MNLLSQFALKALGLAAILFLTTVLLHFGPELWRGEGFPADADLLYKGVRALFMGVAIIGIRKLFPKKTATGETVSVY